MNNKILDYFKKINTKKVWFLVGGVFVICALLIVYLNYNGSTHQKCPDEYGDDDASINQKLVDFDNWTKEFYETHPDAGISDLSKARYDFYVKNKCTSSIQRYNDAVDGKGDPETMKLIDDAIARGIINYKCPEDYTEDDAGTAEYEKAMLDWTRNYLMTHAEPTALEWAKEKYQLLVDNNCVVAIQRSKMSGKTTDLKPYELIDDKLLTTLVKTLKYDTYTSELGFSFDYPRDFHVANYPGDPRLFVIPNSYNPDSGEQITAVVISYSINDPFMTPMEWLKGPNSGADMSKKYNKIDIDGQEAISLENDTWVVVDTPDNKYQISIATLPSSNPSELLRTTLTGIVATMSFK